MKKLQKQCNYVAQDWGKQATTSLKKFILTILVYLPIVSVLLFTIFTAITSKYATEIAKLPLLTKIYIDLAKVLLTILPIIYGIKAIIYLISMMIFDSNLKDATKEGLSKFLNVLDKISLLSLIKLIKKNK